jgi:D-3-phosphoglycerate dehydrogenase
VNSSRGEVAYTVVDLDAEVPPELVKTIAGTKGVLMARLMPAPEKPAQ